MKGLTLLQVEYGSGSETYNFDEAFVELDGRRIVTIYRWTGWLRWMFAGWFGGVRHRVYFGFSYAGRDRMIGALNTGWIPTSEITTTEHA